MICNPIQQWIGDTMWNSANDTQVGIRQTSSNLSFYDSIAHKIQKIIAFYRKTLAREFGRGQ
eukprot:scaffold2062_cov166-Amphora_coffeaeformis.AAC.5